MTDAPRRPMTAPMVAARKGGEKLKMVTAYDAPTARIADRAGADIILVGDSVANVVLGHDDTLAVSVDVMVHHTAAVTRTKPNALVVGDMPWLSYHSSTEDTVANAGRLVREGGASAVKLEGGRKRLPMIQAVLDAEIPVMGHLGLTPQSVRSMGGYRVQGRGDEAAARLRADALAIQDAGAELLVLECVPNAVAAAITAELQIPVIGIGAGVACDGQVLVMHDMLGVAMGRRPRFVKDFLGEGGSIRGAIRAYIDAVRDGSFPDAEHSYES